MSVDAPIMTSGEYLISSVLLVIEKGGVRLPQRAGLEPLPLGFDDLVQLERLASGASTTELTDAEAIIETLRGRGLIAAEPQTHEDGEHQPALFSDSDGSLPEGRFTLSSPLVTRLTSRGFEFIDHEGSVMLRLSIGEIWLTARTTRSVGLPGLLQFARDTMGERAPKAAEIAYLLSCLLHAGLIRPQSDIDDGPVVDSRILREHRRMTQQLTDLRDHTEQYLNDMERTNPRGDRTDVVPVQMQGFPSLSLGLLMAYASAADDGRHNASFRFVPDWVGLRATTVTPEDRPAIYLFSNYLWTHLENLVASASIKAASPYSVLIHGGPDTPKYEGDAEAYLRMNPHVDIIVRGEGEATFAELLAALSGRVGDGPVDLDVLADVAGLTYRVGDRIVRTGDRDRIADIDEVPSPYLTGLFDSVGSTGYPVAIIETNRGCPYGCTFCDWGSATLSRIRKFDLDRVMAELEWCAEHKVRGVYLADANFGIFARDVDIAAKVAQLHQDTGYPQLFETNYAKNTVKHVKEIVSILVEGGIVTFGLLSLQSMDQDTLDTIRRSNIKLEKYEALAQEFRDADLPLMTDIMMGLPGSTIESFTQDLQECVDREMRARVFPTSLLVNSPMNDPVYREENKIVTDQPLTASWDKESEKRVSLLLVSTASYTQSDYEQMQHLRALFMLCENSGVLRQVARFVHQEAQLPELAFYAGIKDAALARPDRYPTLEFVVTNQSRYMVAPGSWAVARAELLHYLTSDLGIVADSALDTVLTVQHGLQPARGRSFPLVVDLAHDYAAWYQAILLAKYEGHYSTWPTVVPPLSTFGPASFEITDPQEICTRGMGSTTEHDIASDWELGSPVARPMGRRQLVG